MLDYHVALATWHDWDDDALALVRLERSARSSDEDAAEHPTPAYGCRHPSPRERNAFTICLSLFSRLCEEERLVSMHRKRSIDLIVAGTLTVLLAPVMAIIAAAIWSTMGSPILFRQVRPGYRGRPFVILKFRTLREEADPDGRPLPIKQRLTPLGYFLRRTSLDELPQLWNVIKGDMSLVGPRPLLMAYLSLYSVEQARRHEMRPGLTGIAQATGRHFLTWHDRFALDTWYVDNWSLSLDIKIVGWTIKQALAGKGSAPADADDYNFTGATWDDESITDPHEPPVLR